MGLPFCCVTVDHRRLRLRAANAKRETPARNTSRIIALVLPPVCGGFSGGRVGTGTSSEVGVGAGVGSLLGVGDTGALGVTVGVGVGVTGALGVTVGVGVGVGDVVGATYVFFTVAPVASTRESAPR